MIVDYLNRFWSTIGPSEADTILIVDPYTVLARPFATQGLKSVTWRDTEVVQMGSRIELLKLEECSPFQLFWQRRSGVLGRSPVEDIFCASTAKRSDHINTITRISC